MRLLPTGFVFVIILFFCVVFVRCVTVSCLEYLVTYLFKMFSKPYNKCCIASCEGTDPLRTFHEFPSNHNLREKWFKNLRFRHGTVHYFKANITLILIKVPLFYLDQQLQLPERAVVCSLHFYTSCFKNTSERRLLKRDAVPALFLSVCFS